jgi:hypothetical protein
MTMQEQTRNSVWIANEIRRWQIAEAAWTRSARKSTEPRPRPIRRAIGRSIIRIGERVAAEPAFRPARSR